MISALHTRSLQGKCRYRVRIGARIGMLMWLAGGLTGCTVTGDWTRITAIPKTTRASADARAGQYVAALRDKIDASANFAHKAINQRIQPVFIDGVKPYVRFAQAPAGASAIVISAGTVPTIEAMILMRMAWQSPSPLHEDCARHYTKHLRHRLGSTGTNRDAPLSTPPLFYRSLNDSRCQAMPQRLRATRTADTRHDALARDVLQFLYLRELARGAGDPTRASQWTRFEQSARVNKPSTAARARALKRQRAYESASDDWAVDRFVTLTDRPLNVLRHWVLADFLRLGGVFSCANERLQPQPSADRRYARIVARLVAQARDQGKITANERELVNELRDNRRAITQRIDQRGCPLGE